MVIVTQGYSSLQAADKKVNEEQQGEHVKEL